MFGTERAQLEPSFTPAKGCAQLVFAALIAVPTGNRSPYPLCLERGRLISADEVSISFRTQLWIFTVWQASWRLWNSVSNTQNGKLFKTGVAVSHQCPKNHSKGFSGYFNNKTTATKKTWFFYVPAGKLGGRIN